MSRRALITGITGQDGTYLAELLLAKSYEVHGVVRLSNPPDDPRIAPFAERIVLHRIDLTDPEAIERMLRAAVPHEIYNLAGPSFVPAYTQAPLESADVTVLGLLKLLEAIRRVDPAIRFFQAGSSEIFGRTAQEPQNEQTPLRPGNLYGTAKTYAHCATINYRENAGLFACSGILFNHESPRRGLEFVTRKITASVARIKQGLPEKLKLGNLDAQRDWGFAGDYVAAMWLMLQQDKPQDYVIATGVKHSVRELLELAFGHVGLSWQNHVEIDPALLRPADTNTLRGDARLAREQLGWQPRVTFEELVTMMVDADVERVRRQPVST